MLLAACAPATDGSIQRLDAALPRFQSEDPPAKSVDERAAAIRLLLGQARWKSAQAELERWWQSEAAGEAAFLLGWMHHKQGHFALALPWLERALAAGPTYPKARQVFFLFGRCLQESGHLKEARRAYEADGLLYPEGGDSPFRLALLDFEEGQLVSCEARLITALERFDTPREKAKVLAHLADLHLARDELGPARARLEECVKLYPHYEAFYKLSKVCARLGDEAAAQAALEQHRYWRERTQPSRGQ